jgi:hypothetical protein
MHGHRNGDHSADAGSTHRRLTGSRAVMEARQCLRELTGHDAESISALQRTRDGWSVQLETVELERIPQTTDIMASYVVELDQQGELVRYERVSRYYRNQATPADE